MMKKALIQIGTSRGLILDKPILELLGFVDEVEIQVSADGLLIRPAGPATVETLGPKKRIAANQEAIAVAEKVMTKYSKALKDLA